MTPLRKIVARNLKALRDARGLGQVELAVIAGVDRSYISDIEHGKYRLSIDKLDSLAEALGIAPGEILHPLTATQRPGNLAMGRADRQRVMDTEHLDPAPGAAFGRVQRAGEAAAARQRDELAQRQYLRAGAGDAVDVPA